jgi:hypothetical protein
LRHHYVVRDGTEGFGSNDSEIDATFAFPVFQNPQTPVLVTPGFAVHMWDGPFSAAGPISADLPPLAYDAYLGVAWNPQINPWLGAELGAQIGIFSDFSKVTEDSIRVPAHGIAVLSFSPSFQIKAGVIYLDRNEVKLLPAGGIVWTPNADTRFEILFPNPKLASRLTTIGTTDWWWYLRGEYGGGAWTVKRVGGAVERMDYNDLRAALGLQFVQTAGVDGFFEVGFAFDREIVYVESPQDHYKPGTTLFLGGGVTW